MTTPKEEAERRMLVDQYNLLEEKKEITLKKIDEAIKGLKGLGIDVNP